MHIDTKNRIAALIGQLNTRADEASFIIQEYENGLSQAPAFGHGMIQWGRHNGEWTITVRRANGDWVRWRELSREERIILAYNLPDFTEKLIANFERILSL